MTLFAPTTNPDYSSQVDSEITVDTQQYGDGYESRATTSLNPVRQKFQLSWNVLPREEALTYERFMLERKGVESFEYVLPGEDEVKKWVCRAKVSRQYVAPGYDTISFQIEQVFEF